MAEPPAEGGAADPPGVFEDSAFAAAPAVAEADSDDTSSADAEPSPPAPVDLPRRDQQGQTREQEFAFNDAKLAEKIAKKGKDEGDTLNSLVEQLRLSLARPPRYVSGHELAVSKEQRTQPPHALNALGWRCYPLALLLALALSLPFYLAACSRHQPPPCVDLHAAQPGLVDWPCLAQHYVPGAQPPLGDGQLQRTQQGLALTLRADGFNESCLGWAELQALSAHRTQRGLYTCLPLLALPPRDLALAYSSLLPTDYATAALDLQVGSFVGNFVLLSLLWVAVHVQRRHVCIAARGYNFLHLLYPAAALTQLGGLFLAAATLGLVTGDTPLSLGFSPAGQAVRLAGAGLASLGLTLVGTAGLCQERVFLVFLGRLPYTGHLGQYTVPLLPLALAAWLLLVLLPSAVHLYHPTAGVDYSLLLALLFLLLACALFAALHARVRPYAHIYGDSHQNARFFVLATVLLLPLCLAGMAAPTCVWYVYAPPYVLQVLVLCYVLDLLLPRLLWIHHTRNLPTPTPRPDDAKQPQGPVIFEIMVL